MAASRPPRRASRRSAPTRRESHRPPSRSHPSRARRRCSGSGSGPREVRERPHALPWCGSARPRRAWIRRARSGVGSGRISSSAQRRLIAVGREAASTSYARSTSSPCVAASAIPYAAATPMAGAPRTARVRIASASSTASWQRSSTTSSGSRRWSSTTTASASSLTIRSGSRSERPGRRTCSPTCPRPTRRGTSPAPR